MKKTILFAAICLLFLGCKKEVVEPEYRIEGYYVLDDGSNLTDEYILFKDATLSVFKAQEKLIFIDGKIWNFAAKFSTLVKSHYSIQNGVLKSELWANVPIKLENGILKLGGKKYSVWSGESKGDQYSSIDVQSDRKVPYSTQLYRIPYSINRPIKSGHLTAVSYESWLTVEEVSKDRIIVRMDENDSGQDRTCSLHLSYDGGATATCVVTQNGHPVSIELNKPSLVLYRGTSNVTETLTAIVSPSDASNTAVSWASSNTSVATVSSSGMVTAKARGYATITASAQDGNGAQATCEVEVKQYVTRITLHASSLSFIVEGLVEGQEETLTATVGPADANDQSLTWSSSDSTIASVDNTGKVTAVSKGTATIKAIANDGSGTFASCSVTVKRLVSSIELNKTLLILFRGASEVTGTLTATVNPPDASNSSVNWTSSNTSVATVSNTGVVTGKARGTATIIVTANDVNGAQANCEVEVKQHVTSIMIDKTSLSLKIGQEATLSVTGVLPDNANDKTFSWSSSDIAVASVDNSGKVTATAKGHATIKAIANDGSGVFSSCTVIVRGPCPDGAVDLGLSVYWATCNIPSSSGYYAWGETELKSGYYSSNYKWGTSTTSLKKYNTQSANGTVDNKTVLDPEDDVAHKKLGGSWRIPTDEEWTELREMCAWTLTSNYNETGAKGWVVTATNGNNIFLPASGLKNGANLVNQGTSGYYWSSSLDTDYPYRAWEVHFYSDSISNRVGRSSSPRSSGLSVRPVSE